MGHRRTLARTTFDARSMDTGREAWARELLTSPVFGLSRTLDDDGRFSTRTHREIPANRRASASLQGLVHRECGRAGIWRGFFGAIWRHAWRHIGCLEGRPRLKNLRHAVNSETLNCGTSCRDGSSPASSGPASGSGMSDPTAIRRSPRDDGRSRSQRAFSTNSTRMTRRSRVNVRPVCSARCFNTSPSSWSSRRISLVKGLRAL
jgi:hypothetical protein